ncbi:hypothetical protein [Streptomyces sp. NPDC088755]|uniref:hypothetical protein n=1 Tax=Streptomyces sp. NPDC088755 TaxID=3365888 RepID=UPI00382894DB
MSFLGFQLRWNSVLLGALVTAAVLNDVPPSYEALVVLAPVIWADRTTLTWVRIRRR